MNNKRKQELRNAIDNKECADNSLSKLEKLAEEAPVFLTRSYESFEKITSLNKKDICFLIIATAIQCCRQYIIGTITQRKGDKESAKSSHDKFEKLFGKNSPEEISDARLKSARYRADIKEILSSFSVPYDVTKGTKEFGVGGPDTGISGITHHFKTLGHDPLFGWVFGTSNIMTNTLTNNIGLTFHVKNGAVCSFGGYDKTVTMFDHVRKRSKEQPRDLAICLIKQGLHIGSDQFNKVGLALPGMVGLNPELGQAIAKYGMDFGNIVKSGEQAVFACLINQIIAMAHRLFFDPDEMDSKLYEVKTRKIILISNLIATSSNVIGVAIAAGINANAGNAMGVKKALNYLDVGGLIVTISRVLTDTKKIDEIKQEYVKNDWETRVREEMRRV